MKSPRCEAERLAATDRSNTEWQRDLSTGRSADGRLLKVEHCMSRMFWPIQKSERELAAKATFRLRQLVSGGGPRAACAPRSVEHYWS